MSIIAVFSGAYSAGEKISQTVARLLDYTLIGDRLLSEAAQAHGTSVDRLARATTGERAFFNKVTHEWEKSIIYIKATLAQYLAKDDLVVHGPAMHLIPREISHVLKVAIVADRDFRVQRAVNQAGIDEQEAARRIKTADEDIARWTEQLFSRGPWDASLYDIKIPVPATSVDDATALICENIAKDALRPNRRSVQAARDFLLATRVNLALLEKGHTYCDVTANDEKITVQINKKVSSPGALVRTIQALRYEQAKEEIGKICRGIEGVTAVETRPGAGFKKTSRALLVDDEEEYVLTLSQRLQTRDIDSDVVHDGEQALDAVGGDEPEVMVLDLRMPGIDGIEVLRRVKRDHPRVEVIIVTGHGSEKDERVARELGAFAYLTKPVDIDLLAETMKAAARRARGED
jgi:two-component system response regulator CpxR